MIRYLLLTLIITTPVLCLFAVQNINPDPNGEAWIVGDLRELTPADWEMLSNLPRLSLQDNQVYRDRPVRVDNTQSPFFRPVFSQQGGSCGQASGVGYTFTYEIDCIREVSASLSENQYPTHYTWNFLNDGVGGGSWYFDGWNIIKANGCPNVIDFGGMYGLGDTYWHSGYQEYFNGMSNRTLDIFAIDVSDEEGLNTLKQWFTDHQGESEFGGLACFGAGASNYNLVQIPADQYEAGKKIMIGWGPVVNHAMTFAGFDDSVRYDYNNDGLFTNDIDLNGDSLITIEDWEIGAIIVVNSWGTGWGDLGKVYMPYRLLSIPVEQGGIWSSVVHVIKVRETFAPLLTAKVRINYNQRKNLELMIGVADDTNAVESDFTLRFPLFNNQGGTLPMGGGIVDGDESLELGLDISAILSYIDNGQPARFFCMVDEKDDSHLGEGNIEYFSVIDYTGEQPLETFSEMTDVQISDNTVTTISLDKTINFDHVEITTNSLPSGTQGQPYSYELSAAGGTEPYNWKFQVDYDNMTDTGIIPAVEYNEAVFDNNDDAVMALPLPFTFLFFGSYYDEIYICTDGSILFNNSFLRVRDEGAVINNRVIAVFAADLQIYPEQEEAILYYVDDDELIVRWTVSWYNNSEFDADFAVRLESDGSITYFYGAIDYSTDWAAGISDGNGTDFLITQNSGQGSITEGQKENFTLSGFPAGMAISQSGVFTGIIPDDADSWQITFKVTDEMNIFNTKTLILNTGINSADNHISAPIRYLKQNFPNPFSLNGEERANGTIIEFALEKTSTVKLEIYNLKGQKVTTLLDDKLSEGTHQISWNGSDKMNKFVGSGIYFYKLVAENQEIIRKMIFVK